MVYDGKFMDGLERIVDDSINRVAAATQSIGATHQADIYSRALRMMEEHTGAKADQFIARAALQLVQERSVVEKSKRVVIKKNDHGFFEVASAAMPRYRWTGSRWMRHDEGVQISNFCDRAGAVEYANTFGFEVVTQ